MTRLNFALGAPIGHRATLGLIVLRTDETVEAEAWRMLGADGVAHYISRVPCQTEISLEGLAMMEAEIPRASALLPSARDFDVVAYACTSGATSIGPARVETAIRAGVRTRHVTNPLSAGIAALNALGARRLGFVTPYAPGVSQAMRARFEDAGLQITAFGSMEEENDQRVALIDGDSIRAAIREVAAQAPCDAIFLSCTNLRALDVIAEAERDLGIPVLTSNQALCWHMMQLAGLDTRALPYGALMQQGVSQLAQDVGPIDVPAGILGGAAGAEAPKL